MSITQLKTAIKDSLKDKSKEEIIEEYIEMYLKKEKLEKELKKYKNANTPSSANKHLKPDASGLKAKKGAKRGAPKNHPGATLMLPPPEVVVPVSVKTCVNCNGRKLEATGYVKKRTVICYQKAKIIVKEYRQEECRCLDCHTLTLAKHKDIPEEGIYDKNIQSLVNYYKFKARMPHGIVVDVMNNVHDVPMTEPTSLEITRRVSRKLEPEYEKLEKGVKREDVVQSDETGFSVMGVSHWVWVFCNSLLSLFKFNKERGGAIVERTLGKEFEGKLVSDGWGTYKAYVRDNEVVHQRCWAHGKREVEEECKELYPKLYEYYCDIYAMVRRGRLFKYEKNRLKMRDRCKGELEAWISLVRNHKSLTKLVNLIDNGGDDWFTCLLYPEIPPDNNESERSLRPFVLLRKIMGCLRSELGKRNYEVMMSLILTWEKQGKNAFYMLQNTL